MTMFYDLFSNILGKERRIMVMEQNKDFYILKQKKKQDLMVKE